MKYSVPYVCGKVRLRDWICDLQRATVQPTYDGGTNIEHWCNS
jgi:hypothetical protein